MSAEKDNFVASKLSKMTLEEKCGQVLTFTWRGAYLTPSGSFSITLMRQNCLFCEHYPSPQELFIFLNCLS